MIDIKLLINVVWLIVNSRFVKAKIIYVIALVKTKILPNIQRFFLLYTESKIPNNNNIIHKDPKFIASLIPSVKANVAVSTFVASTLPNNEK